MDKEKLKAAIIAKLKHRKKTQGKVNIENVSAPKKHKPKKVKDQKKKHHSPGAVSIGAHGGRYIQEPSGHKRYVKEGNLSGTKKFKKSVQDALSDLIISDIRDFVKAFKKRK